jgi:hypothetical protein
MNLKKIALPIAAACALLSLMSCGGGGGNGVMQQPAPINQPPPADNTGVVGILLKDAPTLDFTRIVMVITSVELLGNGDPKVVFSGEKEIDLLELQNFYDMLAVSDKVPVGEYDKIRLRVQRITLYSLNGDGDEVSEDADIPANGKVDLNPRSPFTVSADVALLIQIDMDAKKSFHAHETGNSRWKFRPVVFVDIQQREALDGLVRISGTIHDVDYDGGMIELCNVETQFETDEDHCVLVNVGEGTSIFDENGDPIEFMNLMLEEQITVFGVVFIVTDRHSDDDDDDGDSSDGGDDIDGNDGDDDDTVRMIQIDAIVIQRGDPAALLSLDGQATTEVGDDDQFEFDVAPGQDFPIGPVNVLVQSTTRILNGEDLSELDATAIQPDVVAEVSGVQPTSEDPIKSILIVIDPNAEVREELNGEIAAFTDLGFTLSIADADPAEERCVEPVEGARFFVLEDSDTGTEIDEVPYGFLTVGQQVSVFGSDPGDGACFATDVTVVTEDAPI